MNVNKFKPGDIVNLKSDRAHRMTVDEKIGETYACMWFDVTLELQVHDFREEVLELSSSPIEESHSMRHDN